MRQDLENFIVEAEAMPDAYMIPVSGKVGGKIRGLSFYRHLGLPDVETCILNFGRCNFRCPFCFRGAQHQRHGVVAGSERLPVTSLLQIIDQAIAHRQMVKLSGGDPCADPELTRFLARYVRAHGGRLGIAHNGSDPKYCESIAEYLEMAAVDIKAVPEKYCLVTGVHSQRHYAHSFQVIRRFARRGIVLDIRTPVFDHTTPEEMEAIADDLSCEELSPRQAFWTWRMYQPVDGCFLQPPDDAVVREMLQTVALKYPNIRMGLRVNTVPCSEIVAYPVTEVRGEALSMTSQASGVVAGP